MEGYGGVGLRRRTRAAELERRRGLHDLPALRLRRRPALPHDGGLQPQAEAAAAGTAPKEAVQALGSYVAEGDGLGSRSGLGRAGSICRRVIQADER